VIMAWMGSALPVVATIMVVVAIALFALEVRDRKAKAAKPPTPQH
jgi:hypothetical protein